MTSAEPRGRPSGAEQGTGHSWLAVLSGRPPRLDVGVGREAPDVSVAVRDGIHCVVQGFVYGLPGGGRDVMEGSSSEAERLLDAYRRLGEGVLDHAKGFFSFVVWDSGDERLLAARDPLGIHPLFYARTTRGLLFSPSIATLRARDEVPGTVNRAALADHLRHQWPRPAETYFDAIARVLSGHALTVHRGSVSSRRYWDPLFPGRRPEWLDEADLGQFDQLLDESVARLLALGRPGIYLSGGLDSVAVGALAADHARRVGSPVPLALSLDFPEPFSEAALQTAVARRLRLPQLLAGLDEVVGQGGLVHAAVRSGGLSAPLQNPWLPAYRSLAGQARRRGCEIILTGSGGDEWLTVTPVYAADLLRSLRLIEFYRLARTHWRSYNVSPGLFARNMAWRFGLRPLIARRRERAMRRFAAGRLESRVMRSRYLALDRRPWLAPDPALRRELRERDEDFARMHPPKEDLLPVGGPREYFRECREALEHPLVSMEAEEVFEYSRGAGVRILHPYWDTRLVEFLHATPPRLLNSGGRSKGLIREMLARRFPELGFDRQRKAITASFFAWSVATQAPAVWRELGGARALADAGIVDPDLCAPLYDMEVSGAPPPDGSPVLDHSRTDPMWEILVLESWLRSHV
jgi:asparagine synthetase B (glutamine-hydrolysing)